MYVVTKMKNTMYGIRYLLLKMMTAM